MNALSSLADIVFYVYIVVLMLRLFLQKMGANYYNAIIQFLIKVTEPVIKPMRRFVPGYKGYDLAIVALIVVLELLSIWVVYGLRLGVFTGVAGTFLIFMGDMSSKVINIFFFAVIIAALLSWVSNPKTLVLEEVVGLLAQPVVKPFQRIIPIVGGFDLSPLAAIIALKLVDALISYQLIHMGVRQALSV